MIRNFKTLGLALVAVFAISAVAASAASAVEYHASAEPTSLSGTQVAANVFHVPGAGSVSCTEANFTGTISPKTVQTLKVHPTYGGCSAFGFTAHITTTGCDFEFTQPTGGGPVYSATVHVVCGGTSKIKITPTFFGSSVCTIEVGSQTPAGGVDIENKETESHVLVTSTTTGINHTAGCGAAAGSNGEYTGSVTEKGGANKIWVT
jgi:hypothetical protein